MQSTLITLYFLGFSNAFIIYFRDLPAGGKQLNDVGDPLSIFISRSTDRDSDLKQIQFNSLKNAYDVSVEFQKNDSYLLLPWNPDGSITVTTSLSSNALSAMNGFIYYEKKSLADTFYVYDVQNSSSLLLKESSTVLFLNSIPGNAVELSKITQTDTSLFLVYPGIPQATQPNIIDAIFSNPSKFSDGTKKFFMHIEPLFFGLDSLYVKTNGQVAFQFETKADPSLQVTASYTTTGFVMNARDTAKTVSVINRNGKVSGTTRVKMINRMGADVALSISYGKTGLTNKVFYSNNTYDSWMIDEIANKLNIRTNGIGDGNYYYLQYYVEGEN
ncbi:unnamed protein product [Caenorhabditis bovis]|uniref:Uncharacterized protein n=1 Tax=Caenorhabditis bovis TaxID=2654633 RepID=A0A8S1DYP4_9PELO|nr:unnamed protein product [Caenorhabditis bovis]